jgi:DNA-binding HxlR family transcriptional regulator
MKNMTNGKTDDIALPECQQGREVEDFHRALGMITGKWKCEILWQLSRTNTGSENCSERFRVSRNTC